MRLRKIHTREFQVTAQREVPDAVEFLLWPGQAEGEFRPRAEHPVLSKTLMLRGVMGEKERAELAAFEALIAKWIADALVAQLQEEAA